MAAFLTRKYPLWRMAGITMKSQMALALALLLPFHATTLLADEDSDDVMEKLMLFNLANGLDDYEAISDPLILLLDEDDSSTEQVYLEKNNNYMITVVCDDDCDDVDVWLFDEDGDLMDSDTESDDTAVISGQLEESGYFTVEIEVSDCDSEPCYVGAQAFRK